VPTGLVGVAAASAARAPLVVTAHGTDVANAGRRPLVRTLTRFVLRRAAAVVAVSGYLAERLPDGARRVEVIDCGVDTARFRPGPRAAGEGPRFLFVGSLIPRKNVGRLLEAFAAVGAGSLTVVGDGPEGARLRAGAPPGVRFLGRLTPDRVAAELAAADVLVAPSLVEPQGQQVLEAMACGRPVVATRVGGPAELVDAACGVLVDPADPAAIAEGMRRAAGLPVPCDAAVRVAVEHARERQAGRVEALLAEVAAGAAR
jgi:D-inositol-3-phosphate glycosyltransferase